ncbi:MAG: arsenite methyltransferase [Bacteroidia bacterium]|nr:arsenite methyltransferase [Bacteroidia bacterium]
MKNNPSQTERLKEIVKEKYTEVANNDSDCCGALCGCGTIDESVMADDYHKIEGYVKDADLGLGCGLPTEYAQIKPGNTVVDLGAGAGNDAFVARAVVGEKGKVIGIDFTEKMIDKARANADKLGYNNVEFRYGDIEQIPIGDNAADVVVSNCVMNLVPNKGKAFQETYRILKPGGHFSISDIVLVGDLPDGIRHAAEMYAGCVSGAIQKSDYLSTIIDAGFANVQIQKEKRIVIPAHILREYVDGPELAAMQSKASILSITVYGEKPGEKAETQNPANEACCEPGCAEIEIRNRCSYIEPWS